MKFKLLCMIYDAFHNPTSICFSRPDLLPSFTHLPASSKLSHVKFHENTPCTHSVPPHTRFLTPLSCLPWPLCLLGLEGRHLFWESSPDSSYPWLDSHNTLLPAYFMIPFCSLLGFFFSSCSIVNASRIEMCLSHLCIPASGTLCDLDLFHPIFIECFLSGPRKLGQFPSCDAMLENHPWVTPQVT